jgi:hypothetical protein
LPQSVPASSPLPPSSNEAFLTQLAASTLVQRGLEVSTPVNPLYVLSHHLSDMKAPRLIHLPTSCNPRLHPSISVPPSTLHLPVLHLLLQFTLHHFLLQLFVVNVVVLLLHPNLNCLFMPGGATWTFEAMRLMSGMYTGRLLHDLILTLTKVSPSTHGSMSTYGSSSPPDSFPCSMLWGDGTRSEEEGRTCSTSLSSASAKSHTEAKGMT